MLIFGNSKTSCYTYNTGGQRIMKSYGTMEGVYINGAPQGITFHETDNFTIYPAPIITVTKNRFTKHYFIGNKRVASKLGVGKFSNVYGISGNNVTAGQKDYATRMMQIEKQREEYYKSLGTPPGVPTMKGATADPGNTGRGYNEIIGDLGDHSVPEGWVQRPKFNEKGDVPGPPIQWQKPEDPDNAQPGYGYVSTDTTNTEEIFFYHSDHLGSTSYITDAKANITQFDAYLPYGELLVDEHTSSEDMPYKFNGKELDQETGLYYYGARYLNPMASIWYGVDALAEKYTYFSPYLYCFGNPIIFYDKDGKEGILTKWGTSLQYAGAGLMGVGLVAIGTGVAVALPSGGTSSVIVVGGVDMVTAGVVWYSIGSVLKSIEQINTSTSPAKFIKEDYQLQNSNKNSKPSKPTGTKTKTRGQMQREVEKGKAPKDVDRIDKAHNKSGQEHVHLKKVVLLIKMELLKKARLSSMKEQENGLEKEDIMFKFKYGKLSTNNRRMD